MVTNKQTAVQLILTKFSLLSDSDFKYWMINNYDELIEMEREQIEMANECGYKDGCLYANGEQWAFESPQQYYEQTYGGQNE